MRTDATHTAAAAHRCTVDCHDVEGGITAACKCLPWIRLLGAPPAPRISTLECMDPVTSFPHLTLRPLAVNWQGAFLTTSSSFPLVHCYQTDWPGIDSSPVPRTTAKHNIECLLSATHLS
jgi:hypothetical protein